MKFDIPSFISEMPTREYWKSMYPNHRLHAKIAFTIAVKVYWRTVMSERQNHKCCYCGIRTTDVQGLKCSATIEHVIPKSEGGEDNPDNYVMACMKCNNKRKNMPIEQFLDNNRKIYNNSHTVKILAYS